MRSVAPPMVLLTRFCTRLAVATARCALPEGNEMCFIPHLYYALISMENTAWVTGRTKYVHDEAISLTEEGLFTVDIDFQKAHLALEGFMINGSLLFDGVRCDPASAWFKKGLVFNGVLCMLAFFRLLDYVQVHVTPVPGHAVR